MKSALKQLGNVPKAASVSFSNTVTIVSGHSKVAKNAETNRTLEKHPKANHVAAGNFKVSLIAGKPTMSFEDVDFVTEFLSLYVQGKENEIGKTCRKPKEDEVYFDHGLYTDFLNVLYDKAFGPIEVESASAGKMKKTNKSAPNLYATSKGAIINANQYLLFMKLLQAKKPAQQSDACAKIRAKEVLLDEEQEAFLLEAKAKKKTGTYADDLIESIHIFRAKPKNNAKDENDLKLPEAENNASTCNSSVGWSKDESDENLMLMYETEMGHKARYMPDLTELITPPPGKQRIVITTLASTMYKHNECMAVGLQKKVKRLRFNVPAHLFPPNAPLHLISFLPAQFLPSEFIAGGVFASNELTREYYPYGILGANMKIGPTPAIFVGLRFNKIAMIMEPKPVVEALYEHDVTIGTSIIQSQLMKTARDLLKLFLMQEAPKTNFYVPSLQNFQMGVNRLSKIVLTEIPQFMYLHSAETTYAAMHEDVPTFELPQDMFINVTIAQRPVFLPLRFLPAGFEAGCVFSPNTVTVEWYNQHVSNVPIRRQVNTTPAFFLGRWHKSHDMNIAKEQKQEKLTWKNAKAGPNKFDLAANAYIPVNEVITQWKAERPSEQPIAQESFTWQILQQMLDGMHPVHKNTFIFHHLCSLFVVRVNAILVKAEDNDISLHMVLQDVLIVGRRLYGTATLGMHHFTRTHMLLLKGVDIPFSKELAKSNSSPQQPSTKQPLQRLENELIYVNSKLAIFTQLFDAVLNHACDNEDEVYKPITALREFLPAAIIEGQKLYGTASVAVNFFSTFFKNVDFYKEFVHVEEPPDEFYTQLEKLVMIETVEFTSF